MTEITTERISIGNIADLNEITEHMSEETKQEMTLSPREIGIVKRALEEQEILGNHASIPLICMGPACVMSASCPLQMVGKPPVSKKCPIELSLMNKWKDQYVESLDADWEDKIDRQSIMDLVEADILQARTNGIIAKEGFIMENVVGISESTGEPIHRKEMHIAVTVKDMIYKRKERLLKTMVATKEMKKKLGEGKGDPSKKEAGLLERLRKAKIRDAKVYNDNNRESSKKNT